MRCRNLSDARLKKALCPRNLVIQLRNLAAATCASRLDTLSTSDLDSWLVVCGGGTHALLDLACHGEESLLDVAGVLGRGLEEWDTERVGKLLLHGLVFAYPQVLSCDWCMLGCR